MHVTNGLNNKEFDYKSKTSTKAHRIFGEKAKFNEQANDFDREFSKTYSTSAFTHASGFPN